MHRDGFEVTGGPSPPMRREREKREGTKKGRERKKGKEEGIIILFIINYYSNILMILFKSHKLELI